MKKSFSGMGLVILLVAVLIAGCGGGGNSSNPSPSPSSSSSSNKITVTSSHVINSGGTTVTEKYANAYKINGANLLTATLPNSTAKLLAYDTGITAVAGADGITLTNTTTAGNLFFTIGYNSSAGCFDFTALNGQSGKISIDFEVDVNGNGGGGTYIKAFNGSSTTDADMVTTQAIITNGTVISDTIKNIYTNESNDNVYFRVTLPKGGVMKIRAIYLYMETTVTGFANIASAITGGTGAAETCTYTVSNAAGFKTALASAASDSGPSIIKVNGEVGYTDWCTINGFTPGTTSATRYINISSSMSNLTILGQGSEGVFNAVGFKVEGTNIIIQNITVHEVLGQDGIQINNGTYVKVDHCNMYNYTTALESSPSDATKDTYDELISVKNNAQYVILSWNYLHGSYKSILVGSNDDADALPDRKVIMHHNYFENCASRLPLYRGGYGHIYNNYYYNCTTGSGINCRTGSKLKIEKNYFQTCKNPIGFWYDTTYPTGYWNLNDNTYSGCTGDQPTISTCTVTFESGYIYNLDNVTSVPSLVTDGAGVGKL